jgi:hypothetical protein
MEVMGDVVDIVVARLDTEKFSTVVLILRYRSCTLYATVNRPFVDKAILQILKNRSIIYPGYVGTAAMCTIWYSNLKMSRVDSTTYKREKEMRFSCACTVCTIVNTYKEICALFSELKEIVLFEFSLTSSLPVDSKKYSGTFQFLLKV